MRPFSGFIPLLALLLFLGALFWAKGRDPFQRRWFNIKSEGFPKAECIAVLPKMAVRPLPVIIYLHGSGGNLMSDGNDLRHIAEMGLAAVGMEYNQTNGVAFAAQFTALNRYLQRQRWADTNAIAWVGFSLGAQRTLAFALTHPDMKPSLLVRISGGWIQELENQKVESRKQKLEDETRRRDASAPRFPKVLLVHGGQDSVFPLADAERVAATLRTNGAPVELKIFPGDAHGFEPNRGVLFRSIGEYCLVHFKGTNAFSNYESILVWQARAKPLWLFWLPAFIWAGVWMFVQGRARRSVRAVGDLECGAHGVPRPTHSGIALRWLAGILATLAIGQTALHLGTPQLAVSKRTLDLARKHLVQAKELKDFEFLAAKPIWSGKKLRTLLVHVELADYNRELINWKLDDEIYRDFVLSPEIDPAFDGDRHWRRELWENFYPRIRHENDPAAAAEIVVRFLRERVTISDNAFQRQSIAGIWERELTDEAGFERVYVAALRSVSVAARISSEGRAEMWSERAWVPAPGPWRW